MPLSAVISPAEKLDSNALATARSHYRRFLGSTAAGDGEFRLTTRSDVTPYARCFAIFGLTLLRDHSALTADADMLVAAIRADLSRVRERRTLAGVDLRFDKPYLQLLTFSLSALAILGRLDADPLAEDVTALLSWDVHADFVRARVYDGAAGSGNQAMFMAILLLHARDRLGVDDRGQIARWLQLMTDRMNRFGFWGGSSSMSHLQFQNGYHQYEILEYLGAEGPYWVTAADETAALSDEEGHFSPYPGGGPCYDYDAAFLITGAGPPSSARHRRTLLCSAASILAAQNVDGGFCDSHYIRPRSLRNVARLLRHVASGRGAARVERLRYGVALLRPAHDRIRTHWSLYSREWSESNLWDSWFRMLTLARIDVALDPTRASAWGFVDYPGIGHHYSIRRPETRV